jgi:GT2 family glycosyltransferase
MTATALDFLELPMEGGDAIRRDGETFEVVAPWALARFGKHALRGGWWVFELDGEVDPFGCEVRLSNADHPLIVAPGDLAKTFRLHVALGSVFDVAVLVSPWPGRVSFRRLRMRRMNGAERWALMAQGFQRLLRSDRPVTRIAGAAKRMLSGRTVGVRTEEAAAAPVAQTSTAASGPARVERRGDIVVMLGAGESLDPRALALAAGEFARSRDLRAIYGDVREGGSIMPRPEWDSEVARHADPGGTPAFFRESVFQEGKPARQQLEAIFERHDSAGLRRIPLPLAERNASDHPVIASPPLPKLARTPHVSAIIPTKFHVDLLERCLAGLAATEYPDIEAIVVDNGCTDPRFAEVLAAASNKLKLTKVEDFGDFNFPRLIASGVARASGDIILVFNDDIEAKQPDWLARIVESVLETDVGAVGARLLYPDGTIQHAGVMMGLGGICGHLWKGTPPDAASRNPYISLPGQRTAVTGACLAIRRDVWDRIGGMDAEAFPVAFNDIDLCLRLGQAGYRILYRGDAVLTHHESQSRGADDVDEPRRKRLATETGRFLERWKHLLADDPFGSPAFDPQLESGQVHRSLRLR